MQKRNRMKNKILEKIASILCSKLEKKYIFLDFEKNDPSDNFSYSENYLTTDFLLSPPHKGEFFILNQIIWEVVSVTHSLDEIPGYIFLKKAKFLSVKNGIQ